MIPPPRYWLEADRRAYQREVVGDPAICVAYGDANEVVG